MEHNNQNASKKRLEIVSKLISKLDPVYAYNAVYYTSIRETKFSGLLAEAWKCVSTPMLYEKLISIEFTCIMCLTSQSIEFPIKCKDCGFRVSCYKFNTGI